MKVHVTVIEKQTADFDVGDVPASLIEDLLKKGKTPGFFTDTDWSIWDLDSGVEYELTDVKVEEVEEV